MPKKSIRSLGLAKRGVSFENHILATLPKEERERILPLLELVSLNQEVVLQEAGAPAEYGYFVNHGMISTLTVMSNGDSVEVAIVGSEGFAGLPILLNILNSSSRLVVQVGGTGLKIAANELRNVLPQTPMLERLLSRYGYLLALHTAQIAACNRLHELVERLSRWLLMTQDRVHSELLPLTHEFLANMLGTRRSSVTLAAGILQKAGIVEYRRGKIHVLQRRKLEESACECYPVVRTQFDAYLKSGMATHPDI